MSISDRPYMHTPRQSESNRSQPSSTSQHNRSSKHTPPPPTPKHLQRLIPFLLGLLLVGVWLYIHPVQQPTPSVVTPTPILVPPIVSSIPSIPTVPFATQTRLVPPTTPQPSRYASYLNAINPASNDLRALAYAKTKTCPPGDKNCAIAELYRYVQHDIGYLSDPVAREYIQPPEATLQIGAGDCEDLSILLSSLLENVGVPTYLVFTRTHAYVLACQVDRPTMADTIDRVYSTPAPERVTEETRWLEPNHIVTWNLSGAQSHKISYTFDASEPIDWILVPTSEDAEAVRQNRAYRTYPECSREQMFRLTGDCQVSSTAQLLARNRTNQAVRLAATLRFHDPPVRPQLPAALQTYNLDGTNCLTLDPSIKGMAYPGQAMPATATAPERIAVNRAGQHRQLP